MTAVKQTLYSGRDVPRSAKVICCGRNYRAHVAELGNELPAHPTLFTKFADSLTGAGDDVVITPAIEEVGRSFLDSPEDEDLYERVRALADEMGVER